MTSSEELHATRINSSDDIIMKELHNLTFLQEQWDFFALVGLASSWLGVQFFLRLHAAAQKVDPFSLDIRDRTLGIWLYIQAMLGFVD